MFFEVDTYFNFYLVFQYMNKAEFIEPHIVGRLGFFHFLNYKQCYVNTLMIFSKANMQGF